MRRDEVLDALCQAAMLAPEDRPVDLKVTRLKVNVVVISISQQLRHSLPDLDPRDVSARRLHL